MGRPLGRELHLVSVLTGAFLRVVCGAAAFLVGALSSVLLAGTLEGRIVDHHSGLPAASVDVRLRKVGAPGLVADLETDAEGRFRAPGLLAGEYRIEVAGPNHEGAALLVRVAESEASVTGVLVRLVRHAVIAGRVTNLQGEPFRGARVLAMVKSGKREPLRRFVQSSPGTYGLVDDRGQYRLYGLRPGEYAVAVSYGPSGGMVGSARGEGVGSGVLLYPDNSRLQFFTVSGGEEYQDVDFVIQPTHLYSVKGRVELPAPNARFSLALASVDQPALAVAMAHAEADGSFRFEGVPPGSYHLFAWGPTLARSGPGAVLGSEPLFGRTLVEVIEENVEEISIPLQKGRSVGFVLRHAAPHKTDGGCPQTARLTLSPLEDWCALAHASAEVSLAKETIINDLPPGRYLLSVSQLGETCYYATHAVIDLTGATPVDLVVVLVAPAGSIHGRVTGAANPTEVAVVLVASDPVETAPPVQITFPDLKSRFAFENLRPGRYRIATEPAVEVSQPGWKAHLDRMFEIEVPGGAPTDIELPVSAGDNKKPEKGER